MSSWSGTERRRRLASAVVEPVDLGQVSFADVAEHFRERPDFALLESQTHAHGLGAYSLLTFAPFARLTTKGDRSIVRVGARQWQRRGDPFAILEEQLDRWRVDRPDGSCPVPFAGGAIGYFGYELGRQLEVLPAAAVDDLGLPDCYLCFYNFAVVLEHESGRMFLASMASLGESLGQSREQILAELRRVSPGTSTHASPGPAAPSTTCDWVADLSEGQYVDAVRRIKEYILAGDVYQVNMTQRLSLSLDGASPWQLYRRLATINAAPFAAYLNCDGHTIVSSSPERFVRVAGKTVETRPIKGTIKRGRTPEEDAANRSTLYHSTKNRAELAMIVDLLRNDIGRVCAPGSVVVCAFPELESYASVHHLVATITGELEGARTIVDVLRATFPGGSITGAPKIRAMEIIDELEPVVRGVYTGSIGYLGFDGTADLNIAIRTVVVKDGRAYVHAGGGVVADSDEHDEYDESLLKASKLIEAVRAVVRESRYQPAI